MGYWRYWPEIIRQDLVEFGIDLEHITILAKVWKLIDQNPSI
jgi:hypothetical protein